MENEKNQGTEGVSVHDIVAISTHRRTGKNGEKLGYSFYEKDIIGIVIIVNQGKLVLKKSDGGKHEYDVDDINKDYYYTIGQASEFQYENELKKEIAAKIKSRDDITEEIKNLTDWLYDFKHSISLIGRIAKFIKNSSK